MIQARTEKTGLDEQAARLICERSTKQSGTHFEWTNDPALYWVSPILMNEDQAQNFLSNIEAPALTITALPYSPFISEEKVKARCATIPNGRHLTRDGGHHFHMDQPQAIAATIESFILEQEGNHDASHTDN
jgi:pimeloyl-ACP methyl ester carboxylesterase